MPEAESRIMSHAVGQSSGRQEQGSWNQESRERKRIEPN
jgi:hypothetical protein